MKKILDNIENKLQTAVDFFAHGAVLLISFSAMVLCIWAFGRLDEQLAVPILDSRNGYSYDELMTAFAAYGETGRALYARSAITLDAIFPLSFGSFFLGLLFRYRLHRYIIFVGALVILGVLADFAENIQMSYLLTSYPAITEAQAAAASAATTTKWLSLRIAQVIILLQLGVAFFNWCRKELS